MSRDWGLSIALDDVPRRAVGRRQLSQPPFPPIHRRAIRSRFFLPLPPSPPCSRRGTSTLLEKAIRKRSREKSYPGEVSSTTQRSAASQQRHRHVRGMIVSVLDWSRRTRGWRAGFAHARAERGQRVM